LALLDTIPGIPRWQAEVILAEIGLDMSRFPNANHFASWAGLAPGNNESAGKRRSGKTRPGSPTLRRTLTLVAHAAARSKNTYLSAQYHRLAARRGAKRATIAVAHSTDRFIEQRHSSCKLPPYPPCCKQQPNHAHAIHNLALQRHAQRLLKRKRAALEELGVVRCRISARQLSA